MNGSEAIAGRNEGRKAQLDESQEGEGNLSLLLWGRE